MTPGYGVAVARQPLGVEVGLSCNSRGVFFATMSVIDDTDVADPCWPALMMAMVSRVVRRLLLSVR